MTDMEPKQIREIKRSLEAQIQAKERERQAGRVLLDRYAVDIGEAQQALTDLEQTFERMTAASAQLDAQVLHLQGEQERAMKRLLADNVYFQHEYEKRARYYRSFLTGDHPESRRIAKLFKDRRYKGIVVYPAAVHWQPIQRPQHFLMELAAKGYLCFFCTAEGTEHLLEELKPNLFLLNREEYLLPVLQSMHVLVLNTWLMQNAWIDCLPQKTVWYDILDRVDFFSGYDKGMLLKHHEVLEQAKLVTYSARSLQEFTAFRSDAVLLPNAVRPEDFTSPTSPAGVPDDLKPVLQKRKKILGYFGAIEEWFDVGLIRQLAAQDVEIVLIGHCGIDREPFGANVHFLGKKPYESLPDYAAHFDALLIPFLVNDLTNAVSPVKFFEYCAIGKPILSTPIREVIPFAGPGVHLVEAGKRLDLKAILSAPPSSCQNRLRDIAVRNTWRERVEQAEQEMMKNIDCAPVFANKTFENAIGVFTATFFNYQGTDFYSGGAERYLIDLHEICTELGYKMEIYQYGNFPWYRKFRGIDVYSLGDGERHMEQPFTVQLMTDFNRAYTGLAAEKFALNLYSAFFQAYPEAAHPSIGISHGVAWDNEHSQYENGEQFWLSNLRFIEGARNVEKLISVDTNTPNWLQTVDYEAAQQTVTIANYVEGEEFYPVERTGDRLRIVYPRRLYAARGLYLTLDIVDEVLTRYEQVEFHFVGKGFADDVRAVEDKREKWPGRVFRYHRDPDEMHQVYKDADIVLIPTLYSEGTSLSCLEACASGNAVIATRIGGLTDLIIDGYNGLLISPSREDLLTAVCKLIEEEALRERISRHAVAVSKAFAKREWKEKWKRVIREKLGDRQALPPVAEKRTMEILVRGPEQVRHGRVAAQIHAALLRGDSVFVRPEQEFDEKRSFCRYQILHPQAELTFVPDEIVDLRME